MKVHFTLVDDRFLKSEMVDRTLTAEIIEGSERQKHSQIDRCVQIFEKVKDSDSINHHFVEINTDEIPELIRALQFMYSELKLYEDSLL